jgi:hypothetical protein
LKVKWRWKVEGTITCLNATFRKERWVCHITNLNATFRTSKVIIQETRYSVSRKVKKWFLAEK